MCVPQSPYIEILTPKEDGIRRWSLGLCLGHKGEAFMNEISIFIKETPNWFLALWPHEDTAKSDGYEPETGPSPNHDGF